MTIISILLFSVFGALLNRWRGCGHPLKRFTPKPLTQILLSLPFAVYVASGAYVAALFGFYDPVTPLHLALLVGLVICAGTAIGWTTGHGQYFPDVNPQQLDSVQSLDFLVKPFFGQDPRFFGETPMPAMTRHMMLVAYGAKKLAYRCAFGMALTGVAVTLPAGLATADPVLALSGALKSPCYIIAHRLGWGVAGSEYLTGFVLFFVLFFVWWA